jgi:hypothetical protein
LHTPWPANPKFFCLCSQNGFWCSFVTTFRLLVTCFLHTAWRIYSVPLESMSSTATDTERTIGRLLDRGANLQFARYVKRLAACAGLKLWTNAEVAIPVGMWTGRNKGLVTSYARKKHVIVDPAPVPKPVSSPRFSSLCSFAMLIP